MCSLLHSTRYAPCFMMQKGHCKDSVSPQLARTEPGVPACADLPPAGTGRQPRGTRQPKGTGDIGWERWRQSTTCRRERIRRQMHLAGASQPISPVPFGWRVPLGWRPVPAGGQRHSLAPASGSTMVKVVHSGVEEHSIVPSCAPTISFAMASPSPAPPRFVARAASSR